MTGDPATLTLASEQVPWLRSGPAAKLLAVLDSGGEEARVVGGAVRNTMFGFEPGDVDIATTAEPAIVVKRASAAGFNTVPTGLEHGTVTVVVEGKPFEVTTLRRDIETDGRHAVVRFGRDWRADALRRDFTINALFLDRERKVVDFVGGLEDIKARRVRFIGDAATRISEDLLRILRFFRFHAAYGAGTPDPEGLLACIRARRGVDGLSRERVRTEILKLLVAPRADETCATMAETGILGRILAGVADTIALARMDSIDRGLSSAPDAIRRLAALGVRISEDAARLRERLRLSNDEYRRLRSMAESWWILSPQMPAERQRAILYRIGPDHFRDRALLAFSRSSARPDDESWRALAALPERWTAPKFPLAARDFLERGVEKGPLLGAALAHAEEAWVLAGFPVAPPSLARIVENAINSAREGGADAS